MLADDIEIILDSDMSESPYFIIDVNTPDARLQIMGKFEIGSDYLIVTGLHIGGDPTVTWGWPKLRGLGRAIAEKLDVDYIDIHGAVRTTGANPGRRPRSVRLTRPSAPELSAGSEYS